MLSHRLRAWLHGHSFGTGSSVRWRDALLAFFSERAREIANVPTLDDLCYVSGRDPRLWSQGNLLEDLLNSILFETKVDATSTVLEVGCASGFIARILGPRVGRYVGVDIAEPALEVARRLQLTNCEFVLTDAVHLPYSDASFDAAFCYDVFTNFPRFSDGAQLIGEMFRVVRPGGRVLVGSIPDAAKQMAYEKRVAEVASELEMKFGLLPQRDDEKAGQTTTQEATKGEIICYYFDQKDFASLGARLGANTQIKDIHALNPYVGYRFNVVYTKLPA